ncbi:MULTISPECIES: ribbon-helix-helix domain-containing protein [Pseudomonadaceae]|uniref:ribbon-helix-helix domain-containing protein n=1 Tax=Pseudomonadaceae TaxID=135621 RepID=UPI0024474C70|nr:MULTISPECIES: ribbon-helix-helix domain-containing protein [Pseudomonadaceae]MDH0424968.1 ribbon-helix-helix domain-containing protein [Stutzerimonas stutzeri]
MCNLYASTDPSLYDSRTRSIRLQGAVTSVRLENEFWSILEEIAAGEGYGVPQFINQLYGEVLLRHGEVNNLASLLRVVCTVYLANGRQSAPALEFIGLAHRSRPATVAHVAEA